MKSRPGTWIVVAVGLGLTGFALRGLEASLWTLSRRSQPAGRMDSRFLTAGPGVLAGMLGGFRPIVADFMWLRMAAAWEKRDMAATEAGLKLVSAIDPEPLYFWLNGARITAYDLPEWRIAAAGVFGKVPEAEQQRIRREQAKRAINQLEEARRFHPANAAPWIEQANLELHRLHDLPAAAESYGRAWEQPHAPFYAARLHAELLRRLDRKTEALAWLIKLHPRLPADDEAAGAELVLTRIRTLERELGVPVEQVYHPDVGRESAEERKRGNPIS